MMNDEKKRTENEVLIEAARDGYVPERVLLDPKGKEGAKGALEPQVIVVPLDNKGAAKFSVTSLKQFADEYRTEPERRVGVAMLHDLPSFIGHVNRFKNDASALFAHETNTSLACIYDYHPPGPALDGGEARFCMHRAIYNCPLSDEWKAWTNANKAPMTQALFAEWIETRIVDVADPTSATSKKLVALLGGSYASPSRLLELSRGLSIRVNSKVRGSANMASGERAIMFATEHTDEKGAALDIPSAFVIAIPVFSHGPLYQIPVRLRYRINDGAVVWYTELWHHERALRDAFGEAAALAMKETQLPLFYGTPEA